MKKKFEWPRANFIETDFCLGCDEKSEPASWEMEDQYGDRVDYKWVCRNCAPFSRAFVEAKDEGRRVSEIFNSKNTRCPCGNVVPKALFYAARYEFFCVQCWREWRMLDKDAAAIRQNRRLIKTMMERLKNGNEHQDNRATA